MGSEALSIVNRTRFSALLSALALGILPWILPGRADAFSVEATAGTYAADGPNGYDQKFGALSTSASATSSGYLANSSASTSAAMGTLGGVASASAVTRDTGFAQLATGQTSALFRDTIFVGSDSVPAGTIVTLSIDTNLTGTITGVAGGFEGRGSSNLSAGFVGGTAVATAEQRSDWINESYTSDSGAITFDTTVGSVVTLSGRLDVLAIAEGVGQPDVASSVTASFGSTALFTVDALTPGVVLTSESGHNYSAITTRSDFDGDGDVDLTDFGVFQACFNGPNRPPADNCVVDADFDNDSDVDLADFGVFQACFNGPNRPPASACGT